MWVRAIGAWLVILVPAAWPVALRADKPEDGSSTSSRVETAASPTAFNDIENDPRKAHILRVVSLRIMQGYPDGTFRPKAMVSEREFGDVIGRLLVACPETAKPTFDTKNPEDPITRLRVVMVIIRAVAQRDAVESIADPKRVLSGCSDLEKIPEWGRKHAAYAVEKGFVTIGSEFRPSQPISRSELAEVLAKCLPPTAPKASSGVEYTGLMVDCTGLKLARSMSPAIEAEDGAKVYPDVKHLPSYEFLEDHGLVSYVTDPANSKRSGEKPLVVKAVAVSGSANQIAIISVFDKNILVDAEKTCHFLSNWNVAFLVDSR